MKVALVTAEGVSSTRVHVDTVDGLVTLHGSVATAAERANAEAAARGVRGMREVRNLLQVVPEPAKAAAEVSDAALAKAVSEALAADAALADSRIDVHSVNKGVVLLGGSAQSLSDHLRALEDASRVPGVRSVASQIQSPVKFVDSELWHDGSFDLDLSKRSSAADLWITTAVKERLLATNFTPVYGINVDTSRGEVTLFGVVDSKQARTAVVAEARKVPGVREVADALQVVPPERESAVAEKDEAIQVALSKRIHASRQLSGARLVVEVKNGVARLGGPVANSMDRLTASDARAHDARRSRRGGRSGSHSARRQRALITRARSSQPICRIFTPASRKSPIETSPSGKCASYTTSPRPALMIIFVHMRHGQNVV